MKYYFCIDISAIPLWFSHHFTSIKMTEICKVCGNTGEYTGNLLRCSRYCGAFYHYYCIGLSTLNFKKMSKCTLSVWKCEHCKKKRKKSTKKGIGENISSEREDTKQIECIMCLSKIEDELNLGQFMHLDNITVHYYCLLSASMLVQKGKDNEGILGFLPADIRNEAKRAAKHKCSYCRKVGASIFCSVKKCRIVFHLPCGIQNGSLHQYFGKFRSFCHCHRRKQKVPQLHEKSMIQCLICLCDVHGQARNDTLWSPCCKNVWFHRACVQRLALSTGYFFKCPLCNNAKRFVKEMQHQGIYVPSRDASWELEGNAYDDLLSLYSHCDATVCICPKGRSFSGATNRIWHIILCQTCGSQGCHKGCMKNYSRNQWECPDCKQIFRKTESNRTMLEKRPEFGSKEHITMPQHDAVEPSCSSSSTATSCSSFILNDNIFSEGSIEPEKINVDDKALLQIAQEEYSSDVEYLSESSIDSSYLASFVTKFSPINSQEYCYSNPEHLSNDNTCSTHALSFSNTYSPKIRSPNISTDEDNSFDTSIFVEETTIENAQENISDDSLCSKNQSSSSSLLKVSLKEFLEPKNLAQKIVSIEDLADEENIIKTLSHQSNNHEKRFFSCVDFPIKEKSVVDTIDDKSYCEHIVESPIRESEDLYTPETNQELYNINSVDFFNNKICQEKKILDNFPEERKFLPLQSTEQILTQEDPSYSSSHCSKNNQEMFNTGSSNESFVGRETTRERCSFIVNLFSKFMHRSSLQLSLQNSDEKSALQTTTNAVSPQIPLSKHENYIAPNFGEATGQVVFKHRADDDVEMTECSADTNEELIEVNDDTEVIDVNSDIEIIELDDSEEPHIIFNIDDDVIELVD